MRERGSCIEVGEVPDAAEEATVFRFLDSGKVLWPLRETGWSRPYFTTI
jgi:hypothetical protein